VGEASAVDTDKKDEDLNFDEQVNNFQKVSFLYHFIKKFDVFSHSSRDANSPTGNDPRGIGEFSPYSLGFLVGEWGKKIPSIGIVSNP
jgi:hypothetical protein